MPNHTSGTLSRPRPPPKPSHLSSSFTGTCDSIVLRHYIQSHTTAGSFTSHSTSTATITRAHLGHGYDSSTVDHFVDAFDASSDHDQDSKRNSITRPPVRGRTYTAPSGSRFFDARSDDPEPADTATRLIRNQPIAINGSGASRVGNLRNMFEAALPSTSIPQALSRQNTGITFQHTATNTKPRISNQVRMLQAQITGDRFNGLTAASNDADACSSVLVDHQHAHHHRGATQQSEDGSIYRTATQDLLGDALRMDAVVMPPSSYTDTLKASPPSSFPSAIDTDATISRSTSAKTGLTSSKILGISAQHERDDSAATIRPSHSTPQVAQCETLSSENPLDATARRASARVASTSKKSRLSSIFTASPQSSECSGQVDRNAADISPSASGMSMASRSASENESEAERSREPSMLLADDDEISFSRTSHHLRANDGSCFDLDLRAHTSPTKTATVRPRWLNAASANSAADPEAAGPALSNQQVKEETADANAHRGSPDDAGMLTNNASQDRLRPPSVVISTEPSEEGINANQTIEAGQNTEATGLVLHAPRPVSARVPQPGIGKPARALYDFEGEAAFNELIVRAGQPFEILNEQLAGGWSLGVVWGEDGMPTRGLIPQGWYCYIQDFTRSPPPNHGIEPPPTPDLLEQAPATNGPNLLPAASLSGQSKAEAERGSDLNAASLVPWHLSTTPNEERSSELPPAVMYRADDGTPSALSTCEEPAAAEPETPISVSAFLHIGDQAAQWQQVELADTQALSDGLDALKDQPDIHISTNNAIDGMPSVSTEAHPIIWSALPVTHTYETDTTEGAAEEATTCATSASATVPTATTAPDWKGSIFGRKTFNRFASFVTSGAEDYVLSDSVPSEDERSRLVARKVSGGKSAAGPLALTQVAEADEAETDMNTYLQPSKDADDNHATPVARKEAETNSADPNHHFVIAGQAGPKWLSKQPPFLVQVHHPEKRTKLNGMQEYTVYYVTSTYPADTVGDAGAEDDSRSCLPYDPLGGPLSPGTQVTVVRRFTQFEWLHQALAKCYSALIIPPLPEKQYSGRFASDFIETRRADLEMWISRLVRHPVLRYSGPVRFFLSCEDEAEWRANASVLLRDGSAGGVFAQTWHPDFNFDSLEAAVEAERMDAFLKALEKTINGVGGHNAGKHGLLAAYKGHREGNVATSSTYRDLSYTLLRTLTGAGAGPSDDKDTDAPSLGDDVHRILGPPMGNVGRRSDTGATNEHGAWCWREDCQDCLNLSSALQNTAECLQNVADIYETHARETLLRQHERLKEVSRPHTMAQALLETHRTTLERYREATGEVDPESDSAVGSSNDAVPGKGTVAALLPAEEAEKQAARCETVINVTLSEMDRLHDERVEDYHALGRSLLDGEIELYQSILEQLRAARLHYDDEYYEREPDFHVLASRYQPELNRPKKPTPPLLMPSAAHGPPRGLRSAAMLLSQATGTTTVTSPATIAPNPVHDSSPLTSPALHQSSPPLTSTLLDSTNTVSTNKTPNPPLKSLSTHNQFHRQHTSSYFTSIWR